MLLNKYEDFAVMSKDQYAEELLFKVEKNFKNFKELQDRAFPYLQALASLDPRSEYAEAEAAYGKLAGYAAKFDQLATNQEYVYAALAKRLNGTGRSIEAVRETYLIAVEVGGIVRTMASDCRAKAALIRDTIPRLIFNLDGKDVDEVMMLMVDQWTYSEPAIVLSRF